MERGGGGASKRWIDRAGEIKMNDERMNRMVGKRDWGRERRGRGRVEERKLGGGREREVEEERESRESRSTSMLFSTIILFLVF